MTNGKLTTWFIVRWLEKHPTHRAKAPKTASFPACEAAACGTLYVNMSGWQRSDWTIYNERGKRVRFRKRAELRKIGELGAVERLTATASNGRYPRTLASNNTSETFDVFIRERKP